MFAFHSSAVQQSKMRQQEHCTPVTTLGQNYLDSVYSSPPLEKNISVLQPFIFKCLGILPKQAGERPDVSLGVGRLQKTPPCLRRGSCPTCPQPWDSHAGCLLPVPTEMEERPAPPRTLHKRACARPKSNSAVVLLSAGICVAFFGSGEVF